MIKNKDGSYNKISLGILFAIAIIGIVMLASVLITDKPDIDFTTAIAYCGMITCALLIFYFGNRILSKSKSSTPVSIPVKNEPSRVINPITITTPIEVEKIHTPTRYEIDKRMDQLILESNTKITRRSGSSFNIISGIVTIVIAAITLMVGVSLIGSIQSSMPLPQNSQWSTTMTDVTNTVSTSFNFLGLALLVLSVMFIIGLVGGIVRSE